MDSALLSASSSLVIFIDYQTRLMPVIHDGARVLAEAESLAKAARLLNIPTIGTEQNPTKLGPLATELNNYCQTVLPKMHFDACADGLVEVIHARLQEARPHIVIAGCEAHVCVLQTALGLRSAGYRTWLISCATGSRFAADRILALERMKAEGVKIMTLEMALFEWVRTCQHASFRPLLELVKAR
jgi:nicotinamidase-related amidase